MIEYWFMFPVAIVFSALAMTFGVGGAVFFTPFLSIILSLPASVAVGISLAIEFFGFSSGLVGFAKKRLIAYRLGFAMLIFAVPSAIVGAMLSVLVADDVILTILSVLLLWLAYSMVRSGHTIFHKSHIHHVPAPRISVLDQVREIRFFGVLGGLLSGLVSTGLGELNDYAFLKVCKLKGAVVAGTSVFVVAVTALFASAFHALQLIDLSPQLLPATVGILIFAIPGVVFGAQVGVFLSQLIPEKKRAKYISILFFALGIVTFLSVVAR